MSDAYKCDGCGEMFEGGPTEKVMLVDRTMYDLCDYCTSKLYEMLITKE